MLSPRRGRGAGRGVLLVAASLVLPWSSSAAPAPDLRFPSRSPHATVSQWVGLTNITVAYESPAVGGRSPWASVVAPGALWLIGDHEAPTISFSRDVVVAGARVAAGSYSLLALPAPAAWTIVLNRRTRIWRVSERDPALDVARVAVHPETAAHRERLAFVFADFTDQHATLDLEWEKLRIPIPVELQTDAQVASQILSLDEAWRRYADAAWLALETQTDLPAGLRYADESIALRETWYNTWIKASLLAAVGNYQQARAEAAQALQLGAAANDGFPARLQIEEKIASWPASDSLPDPPLSLAERAVKVAPEVARGPSEKALVPLIKRGLPDLRRCYQRALRQDPGLTETRLVLSITVGSSGQVTNVTFDPPATTETFGVCLKAAVGRWAFPAARTEYETRVPLVLSGRT